ncbi:tautomerase family protein [Ramlibacter sp. PS4R-6]|uniref:tautomerase family protein n=1 Tax=Ramlibacter sp. PS4R-6 TaxID=3133438 RepID=UPI00309B1207
MPILNAKVSRPASPELTQRIAGKLGELTARILKKPPEVTAITLTYVPPEHWVIAGRTLAEHGKSSFYLDIKVTEGTNTKDEMAQYVAETYAAFRDILGELHEESYVYVEEVHGFAYGYGGRTQEYRYVKAKL